MRVKEVLHFTVEVDLEMTQEEFDEAQLDMENRFDEYKAYVAKMLDVNIVSLTHETIVVPEGESVECIS